MKNNKFNKVRIKNRMCYYFDDIIKLENFDINEKPHVNILINDISSKTQLGSNILRIRFNEIDGFVRIYDKTRYLTLFGSEKHDAIYDRIRYLLSLKSGVTYIFSHYFAN